MFEAGIIDPTKVTRVALENAASVAGMLLTTECVLADIAEGDSTNASNGRWRYARYDVKVIILSIKKLKKILSFFIAIVIIVKFY